MISLLFESYLTLFIFLGMTLALVFFLGLYLILKKPKSKESVEPKSLIIAVTDVSAIAGEDVMATQLDLARAYIETDKTQLAKTILTSVIAKGSALHQQEAQQLLSSL